MRLFDRRYLNNRCGYVLARTPYGKGICLDVGGGDGRLSSGVISKGYEYYNVDPRNNTGVAEKLEFEDESVSLVIMKDSLEHFENPKKAVDEAWRVLKVGGVLVGLVPWMHRFHGDDFWRFSHLGLRKLGERFRWFECYTPLWVGSVLGILAGPSWCRLLGELVDKMISRGRLHAVTPFILFKGVK